ncbi:MAG: MBL fold metallo-hydrolase [Gammaproteobacteria bacterium]|nr:MBL fold metallo-hydrolase [Gammaproteobacteria bacterium]
MRFKINCITLISLFAATATLITSFTTLADDDKDRKKKLAANNIEGDFSVMVLGSGGPTNTAKGRASAGYLIFIDGEAKILLDAGGGTYQRFVKSGVNAKDLDIILLSHLHIDHTSDLPSIIKSIYFQNRAFHVANNSFPPGRTTPFRVFGPATNGVPFPNPPLTGADPNVPQYPATTEFIHNHYDLHQGSDRYLNIFTRAISAGVFGVNAINVSPNWQVYAPVTLVDEGGLVIKAVGVNHGPVPALAFRIEYRGKSIVYSGDTRSRSIDSDGNPLPNGGNMVAISQHADLLIYDTAIMDTPINDSAKVFFTLHTTPSRIGEVSLLAGAKKLLLSHLTSSTESQLRKIKSLIRKQGYRGKIKAAKDLQVINLLD